MPLLKHDLIFNKLSPQLQQLSDLIILAEIDSTHTFLENKLVKDLSRVNICTTEKQLAGKGRLERVWLSSFGEDICLSLAIFLPIKGEQLMGLSLVAAIGICRALKSYSLSEEILIKWPNDLIYHDQKLAGILVQTTQIADDLQKAIVSVGININSEPKEGVSLKQILAQQIDRNYLLAQITNQLYRVVLDFAAGGLGNFHAEWQKLDYLYGKTISIEQGNHVYSGVARGVDLQGKIIIADDRGGKQIFSFLDSLLVKKGTK